MTTQPFEPFPFHPADPADPRPGHARGDIREVVHTYRGFHDEDHGGDVAARKDHYFEMVKGYYDLATDFFWNQRPMPDHHRAAMAIHLRFGLLDLPALCQPSLAH